MAPTAPPANGWTRNAASQACRTTARTACNVPTQRRSRYPQTRRRSPPPPSGRSATAAGPAPQLPRLRRGQAAPDGQIGPVASGATTPAWTSYARTGSWASGSGSAWGRWLSALVDRGPGGACAVARETAPTESAPSAASAAADGRSRRPVLLRYGSARAVPARELSDSGSRAVFRDSGDLPKVDRIPSLIVPAAEEKAERFFGMEIFLDKRALKQIRLSATGTRWRKATRKRWVRGHHRRVHR